MSRYSRSLSEDVYYTIWCDIIKSSKKCTVQYSTIMPKCNVGSAVRIGHVAWFEAKAHLADVR